MLRLPCRCLSLLWLAAIMTCIVPSAGRTQAPKPQKIVFDTFDKVEIQGTWYASGADGTKSPCVIFLHKIGGSRLQEGWESLAQVLQDKGFAVLSFDFRGHGDSTSIRPEFWSVRNNLTGVKGASPKKETINYKEFTPTYMTMLVNDIAAARLFVEQKNNARECNSNDIMIVGAEEGASLGLQWIANEWNRRKKTLGPTGGVMYMPDPEGRDLAALVSLSMREKVGAIQLPVVPLFTNPKMKEMPICFFYGEEDTSAKAMAIKIYDKVLNVEKNKKQIKLTYKIPYENKLAGVELLGKKALGVEDLVAKYLSEKVMGKEGRGGKVWLERDVGGPGRPVLNPLTQIVNGNFGIN